MRSCLCPFIEDILGEEFLSSLAALGVNVAKAAWPPGGKLPEVLPGFFLPILSAGGEGRAVQGTAIVQEIAEELERVMRRQLRKNRRLGDAILPTLTAGGDDALARSIKAARSQHLSKAKEIIQVLRNTCGSVLKIVQFNGQFRAIDKSMAGNEAEFENFDTTLKNLVENYLERMSSLRERYLGMEVGSLKLLLLLMSGEAALNGEKDKMEAPLQYCERVEKEYKDFRDGQLLDSNELNALEESLVRPVTTFLAQLEAIVASSEQVGVATIRVGEQDWEIEIDLPEWSEHPDCRSFMVFLFVGALCQEGETVSILLRTLSSEIEPQYNLPIKELRGYRLSVEDDKLRCYGLRQSSLFACCTTDPETGDPIPPEPDVVYLEGESFTIALDSGFGRLGYQGTGIAIGARSTRARWKQKGRTLVRLKYWFLGTSSVWVIGSRTKGSRQE